MRKGSQIGFIFERFSIKRMILNSDSIPGSNSNGNVMLWDAILVSFGALFGEMSRISEKCVFAVPAMKINVFRGRMGIENTSKLFGFWTDVLEATFGMKFVKKGSKMGIKLKKI